MASAGLEHKLGRGEQRGELGHNPWRPLQVEVSSEDQHRAFRGFNGGALFWVQLVYEMLHGEKVQKGKVLSLVYRCREHLQLGSN